jgi:hypothetical protein
MRNNSSPVAVHSILRTACTSPQHFYALRSTQVQHNSHYALALSCTHVYARDASMHVQRVLLHISYQVLQLVHR